MSAIAKTAAIERLNLPVSDLVGQSLNPNRMSPREFDLLVDNINRVGFVDPVFVRPADGGKYRVVGGHHRLEAARYLGFTHVPCSVVNHDDFDSDEENFQLVRMNMIRGRMDPNAFFQLYESMSEKYTDAVLQDAFGFAEEAEFKKLIAQTAKTLPTPALQKKFKEAAAEIKTIDGLSKLLNQMFTQFGDTLPYGYMVVDYGGQRSVWLRVSKATMDAVDLVGIMCVEKKRTVDDVLGAVVRSVAKGEQQALVDKAVSVSAEVEIPDDFAVMPTYDNLSKAKSLQ